MTAMRIAILTTDTREEISGCTDSQPRLGLAPEALLQGFALMPAAEVHVVSCLKEPVRSVKKLRQIFFIMASPCRESAGCELAIKVASARCGKN